MRSLTFVEQDNHLIYVTLYISEVMANMDFVADSKRCAMWFKIDRMGRNILANFKP